MALVLTLMILTLITAMVVEFAYGVYTTTSALYNWKDSLRLSFAAKSGVSLAITTISDIPSDELHKFPGKMVIPVENILEGFSGTVVVSVEDENGKFNMNSLKTPGNIQAFRRLLRNLGLDESIADRVSFWINKDSVPALISSKETTKNAFMDSVDELLHIKGIGLQTYEALSPHVTVYGYGGSEDLRVNINTASIPVIMSLSESISMEQAREVVNQRKLRPFEGKGDLERAGFSKDLINNISSRIFAGQITPPRNFRIISVSEENKMKRAIETVVTVEGVTNLIRYWREM